jgi:hypothetical protein
MSAAASTTDRDDLVRSITAQLGELSAEELPAVARLVSALALARKNRARVHGGAFASLWKVVQTFEHGATTWIRGR